MNRKEHLLTILVEECGETAQRATKALRFGINEVQKGQDLDNAERLIYEFNDIVAMMQMLKNEGMIDRVFDLVYQNKKVAKVEKYLELSKAQGTLIPDLQELLAHPLTPDECFKKYECDRCDVIHNPEEQEVIEMQWYEEPHGCMGGDHLHHDHYFFRCTCGRPIEIDKKDIPDNKFKNMEKINGGHGRGRCIKNVKNRM